LDGRACFCKCKCKCTCSCINGWHREGMKPQRGARKACLTERSF
jgi:hypothetical protein